MNGHHTEVAKIPFSGMTLLYCTKDLYKHFVSITIHVYIFGKSKGLSASVKLWSSSHNVTDFI